MEWLIVNGMPLETQVCAKYVCDNHSVGFSNIGKFNMIVNALCRSKLRTIFSLIADELHLK